MAAKSIRTLWYYGQERGDFYKAEPVYLLRTLPPTMIVGGRLELRPVAGGLHRKYELQ